ncbi:MAG TPA: branched-chain amino acid ABC transporter permease [Pusillimonas sp.]|nr:branched-chain amino acid ABC transporter permease [Pusillimonas sp.]MBC41784.1 branched-chain amino acid ABC transporter permease [Pusillimonas sp.]HBT34186.1 branched-chain amino acid ABC transporter permease [Pusillimonas sp.]HCN71103.1 branched-chain amino acid ABC transporter permease [Pusillimonas sp.]HCP77775.1 branched-chain amino acid ABC transporter permease [Pusillimonas sp.]
MQLFSNILIDGIVYGMVLFIISVGLSVTMGLMRFINLAHGAFAMAGGYMAAWLVREEGYPFLAGLVLAVVAAIVLAALLETFVFRFLYKRTELEQVLFTIGFTFAAIALANFLAGPYIQQLPLPDWLRGSMALGDRTLPKQRVFVIVMGLAVVLMLWLIIARTRFGIWLRASVDNAPMSSSLGINIRLVQCATFAFGAGLAALGGVLGAELMPLEPYYPLKYLVLMLVVVSVGGLGSVSGTLVAALVLGVIDTAGRYLASDFGTFFFYVAMIVLLAWRPEGILRRH